MGVIACANCRFRVNDQAEHCPECGADPRTGEGAFTDPGEVPGSFAMLRGARVLGGHGLPLSAGAKLDVVFGPETLILRPVSDAELTVPYPEITALEIGGPGARRTGGRFIGGGFGPAGAAEGMLIGAALNLLTTRTKVDTVICVQTDAAELFLHTSAAAPDPLRMRLSGVFNILRRQQSASGGASPIGGGQLEETLQSLANLRDQNLITEDEYAAKKAEVLSRL